MSHLFGTKIAKILSGTKGVQKDNNFTYKWLDYILVMHKIIQGRNVLLILLCLRVISENFNLKIFRPAYIVHYILGVHVCMQIHRNIFLATLFYISKYSPLRRIIL